jgi:hypothetical protein
MLDEMTLRAEAECEECGCEVCGCEVCGVEHDEEIHAATLRLHFWFREQVTQFLYDWDLVEVEEIPQVA